MDSASILHTLTSGSVKHPSKSNLDYVHEENLTEGCPVQSFLELPPVIVAKVMIKWLTIWELGLLDTSVCNRSMREKLMKYFSDGRFFVLSSNCRLDMTNLGHSGSLSWSHSRPIVSADTLLFLKQKNIALRNLALSLMTDKLALDDYLKHYGKWLEEIEFLGHFSSNIDSWQLYYDVFTHCPNLKIIVFHPNSSMLTAQDVLDITEYCPNVERLLFLNKFHLFVVPKSIPKKYPKVQPAVGLNLTGKFPGWETYNHYSNSIVRPITWDDDAFYPFQPQLRSFTIRSFSKVLLQLVTQLTDNCSNLTELDFENCTGLNDAALSKLAMGARQLKKLNLSYCTKTTAAGLIDFFQTLTAVVKAKNEEKPAPELDLWVDDDDEEEKEAQADHMDVVLTPTPPVFVCQLEEVNLMKCDVNDAVLSAVANCTQASLRSLDVRLCKTFTNTGVVSVANLSSRLLRWKMQGNDQITDDAMEAIARNCDQLQELVVHNCPKLTENGLNHLARAAESGFMHLTHLDIGGRSQINEAALIRACGGVAPLTPPPRSPHLIASAATSNAALGGGGPPAVVVPGPPTPAPPHMTIPMMPTTPVMQVHNIEEHQAPPPQHTILTPSLTELNISNIPQVGAKTLEALAVHKDSAQLRFLGIRGLSNVRNDVLEIVLQHCNRLTKLDVSESLHISDSVMDVLTSALSRTLTHLDLSDCNGMTDFALVLLAQRCGKTLTTLLLKNNSDGISDMGVDALTKHCKQMAELRLSNCGKITNTSMKYIRLSKAFRVSLRILDVEGCNKITDEGLQLIVENCRNLVEFVKPR